MMPKEANISISIYNLSGQKIKTLCNETQKPGDYKLTWDARNEENQVVSDGVYILILQAGSSKIARKMLLIK